MKRWVLSSIWTMQKKQLPIASPWRFRANPKSNPPIKTLQMKTFVTSGNLECQLCCKICHHPWSDLCILHSSLAIDDNHPRHSIEQWNKRLVVTSNNDVWCFKHQSIHGCYPVCRGKRPCINWIFCSCCLGSKHTTVYQKSTVFGQKKTRVLLVLLVLSNSKNKTKNRK